MNQDKQDASHWPEAGPAWLGADIFNGPPKYVPENHDGSDHSGNAESKPQFKIGIMGRWNYPSGGNKHIEGFS
jgi:hypothetical protein